MKMTTEEAFVKVLQMHGIEHAFGIIGSAMMPISDLFPQAGIEIEQMKLFEDMVCYQEEVRDPSRMAEVLNRVIEKAWRGCAPAQINVPRDYWTQVIDIELPQIVRLELPQGGETAIAEAAALLSDAKFPVILNGAGVIIGDAIPASAALAEKLSAPVCCGYQHNDAFPGNHPMSIDYWPKDAKIIQVDINSDRIGLTKKVTVGIQGDAKAVAESILAKLSPSAGDAGRDDREALIAKTKSSWAQTLTSMDHEDDDPGTDWNERARDREPDRMSPRMAWRAIQKALPREAIISSDIGNNCAIGNAYPSFDEGRKYLAPGLFGPCGYGLPAILGAKIACPDVPVVGFAGDGAFGISMNELTACGRNDWPPITMIVFRNYQWGAEKRNTTLWFEDNFVGTELNLGVE